MDIESERMDQMMEENEQSPLLPKEIEKQYKFQEVFKNVLPYLGSHDGKIVLAQVMIALKLEGVIGHGVKEDEMEMLKIIKDAVLSEDEQKQKALNWARKLLK